MADKAASWLLRPVPQCVFDPPLVFLAISTFAADLLLLTISLLASQASPSVGKVAGLDRLMLSSYRHLAQRQRTHPWSIFIY